jgi:translation initiation factor 2B subunit (eIF-2B alpha/beta/delta family)
MEAARRYYSFDFAESFWDALMKFGKDGKLCSIDRVHDEIKKGDDKLKQWTEKDFSNYFLATKEEDVLESYEKLVQWAQSQSHYQQRAKDVFMEVWNADTWVLAYAIARNITIVTHEENPDSQCLS